MKRTLVLGALVLSALLACKKKEAPPTPAPAPETPAIETPAQPPPAEPAKAEEPAPTEPPKAASAYSAGQKVDVKWGGSWWQAQIVSVKAPDKYLIHYIGWESSWDEWVTPARMRPWTGTARAK